MRTTVEAHDDEEKPPIGTIIRPAAVNKFDPTTKTMIFSYEDLMVTPHGKSPKGDWFYRVRRVNGIWRSVLPGDREGGLIVFVREDAPPAYEIFEQKQKLMIRVVKILSNAVVGVLLVGS